MSAQVIAAIIAAIAAIASPIITLWVTKYWAEIDYKTQRLKAVQGIWRGNVSQFPKSDDGARIEINVLVRLKVSGKTITGDLQGVAHEHQFAMKLNGHFPHEDYIIFHYRNTNRATKQFGTCILNLSSSAVSMTGEFVGFGDWSNTIVSGRLDLTKTAEPM